MAAGIKSTPFTFLNNIAITDNCWLWKGAKQKKGYGILTYQGKFWLAHRLAYQLFIGDVNPLLCVCHHCDNPPCVRPAHLYMDTTQANTQDMVNKGRVANHVGEANPNAKLSIEKVKRIRERYLEEGDNGVELANEYGVSSTMIYDIISNKNWQLTGE